MKEKYDDLSAASEHIKLEISQLEVSRSNAQQQYDTIIAINSQIKMEIANRDNAQSTYSSMVNHNDSTNSRIYSLGLERDNLQNHYINPYINALQEARNALGAISTDSYYYNETIATKHTNYIRVGFIRVKGEPTYTYHTERRFNQEGYNSAVGAANIRIGNAENQLNVQKATYQGKIDTLNTEISSKQSSLYSPVLLEQALQTLNTAQYAVSSRGITLETSEQQIAIALQILNNASSALKTRQDDLSNNEQQKEQVLKNEFIDIVPKLYSRDYPVRFEDWTNQWGKGVIDRGEFETIKNNLPTYRKQLAEKLEAERIEAERLEAERLQAEKLELERLELERIKAEQLEAQRLEAERLQAEKLELERLEAERINAEQLEAQRLEAEWLQAEKLELERLELERIKAEQLEIQRLEAERLQAEKLELERLEAERIKAEQLEIQKLEAERLQAEKLELERLELERIKAEQLKAQKLELESLAKIEEVETVEDIFGLNFFEFELEPEPPEIINIDLFGSGAII
jgi:hypothetical protein